MRSVTYLNSLDDGRRSTIRSLASLMVTNKTEDETVLLSVHDRKIPGSRQEESRK